MIYSKKLLFNAQQVLHLLEIQLLPRKRVVHSIKKIETADVKISKKQRNFCFIYMVVQPKQPQSLVKSEIIVMILLMQNCISVFFNSTI